MPKLNNDVFSNPFSYNTFINRYSLDKQENWSDLSHRVVDNVCGQYLNSDDKEEIYNIIYNRYFIPGGRYLASAGRPFHQVNNCFTFRAEDTREDWADLMQKITVSLMSGGGIGVDYSKLRAKGTQIKRTGGVSSGPIALMHMVNEAGRYIRMGGERRSAIWAGLNWNHPDIMSFLELKNHSELYKIAKSQDQNFSLPMEGTNISVIYDTDFFVAIENKKHENHQKAKDIWNKNCLQAFSTAEPGFGFNFLKDNESLRNACQPKYATVITREGIRTFDDIDVGTEIWDGKKWVKISKKWSTGIKPVYKYTTTTGEFIGTDNHRVVSDGEKIEIKDAETIDIAIGPKEKSTTINQEDVIDGLVIGDGGVHKASNDLVLLYIGKKDYDYFNDPVNNFIIKHRPGINPVAYEIKTTITANELPKTYEREIPDRFLYGSRSTQVGFLRGLFSANGSINGNRICLKQSSYKLIKQVQLMLSNLGIHSYITINKSTDVKFNNGTYTCKESYDINITNGRTIFKDTIGFIQKYKQDVIVDGSTLKYKTSSIKNIELIEVTEVFEITVDSEEHVYWTGGCLVSNCCEVTSEDDSDKCNLGTVWINRIDNKETLAKVVKYATKFLLCGGLYSDVPTNKIREVGLKNNRIGLGLGGIHEWLMARKMDYEVTPELHKWLRTYEQESDSAAYLGAKELDVSIPIGKRAIAPTGTIGIIAESTTGIEPLFCKAYKRRYYKNESWQYEYVIDGAVKRLLEKGIKLEDIKDSADIEFKERVKLQADVQNYVDMSISSTCNMPSWNTEKNNESTVENYSKILLKYAKRLRGFTCYPDGCRSGQPLERVELKTAMEQEGKIFEEKESSCTNGLCGV